jgi:hypothetical protein
MAQKELNQLERDVEDARERLSGNLQRLRSPATISGFKDALWEEVDESRDQLVAKTKETVDELVVKAKESVDELVVKTKEGAGELVATTQEAVRDRAWRFLADIKERAAANPAAALAIGAGLAWRLARKPPIASMLVGAGVVGLMRTNPQKSYPGAEMASQVGDLAVAAREKVEQWSSDAEEAVWQVARVATNRGSETVYGIVQDVKERDKYLLGAAAVALVAAVGIATQRR